MNMDMLKKLNKAEVTIGVVVLLLFIVGIYAVFNKDTYTFPYADVEVDLEESEEITSDAPSAKTGTSPSSGVSKN